MRSQAYSNYLALLGEISRTLSKLTEIEGKKSAAVRGDDLAVLNECMKQEQASSLALRGYEQRRGVLLTELGLEGVGLTELPFRYPEDMQLAAKAAVEMLQRQYQLFRSARDVAQSTLECNLHQIELLLSDSGAAPRPDEMGYGAPSPAIVPPEHLRTDFRA